jgi:hypothetical protein
MTPPFVGTPLRGWHSTTRRRRTGERSTNPKLRDRLSTVDTRFLLVGQYGHMMFDCRLPDYVGKQTQNFGYGLNVSENESNILIHILK